MSFNLDKLGELTQPVPKHKLIASIAVGGAVGAIASLVSNACLLEITLNGFFTMVKKQK